MKRLAIAAIGVMFVGFVAIVWRRLMRWESTPPQYPQCDFRQGTRQCVRIAGHGTQHLFAPMEHGTEHGPDDGFDMTA